MTSNIWESVGESWFLRGKGPLGPAGKNLRVVEVLEFRNQPARKHARCVRRQRWRSDALGTGSPS